LKKSGGRSRKLDPRAILELTARYEDWLRAQTTVVPEDLVQKHVAMSDSPFPFLRATYYAWAHLWPALFPSEAATPRVTAVGDLHLENFGSWRDHEGRLAWGINDFDEAATLPYTNDLVRLATSALLARKESKLETDAAELADVFLDRYLTGLAHGSAGRPIVFGERHKRIAEVVLGALVRPGSFWKKRLGEDPAPGRVPSPMCERALRASLPEDIADQDVQIRARIAGVGSLGRERFVAFADWNGGRVAREAKAIVPSAAVWAGTAGPPPGPSAFDHLRLRSRRSRDPYLHTNHGYVVRRLAPDTGKIEIQSLGRKLERRLAALMGQEVANVHLATPEATAAILADLEARPRGWLLQSASVMAEVMKDCYEAWEKENPR
jgi:hypothetical protein